MTDTQEIDNPPESRICHECGTEIPAGAKECSRCALEAELKAKGFEVDLEALAAELPQLEILEEIGRGGMGVVFKGRQKSLGRDVAIKVLPKELDYDPSFSDRFLRECRTLAGLSHPNVVTVYDAGVAAGHNYLLMELVDGTDLAKLMRSGDVQPDQALSVVSQICEALQYAHDQGVVHRDIKPGNILLDREGHVKLGDFGLAKLLRSDESMRLTGTMQAMGTPQYMAPEQLERPLEVDHRADLYSLGVVLYELLTGELPLGRFEEPSKRADVDVGLDEVVMKTLEKEPDQRYQSASEVRVEVQRASDAARGDGRGRPRNVSAGAAGRSSKYGARHYLGYGLLLTALVWVPLLIVAVFIFPSTKELLVFFIGAPVLVGLVGWGIRRLTRDRSVAYRLGVVLLVFAVLVCLGASLLMISAGGRLFILIPLACAVVAAFLIGGLVILRGKKDKPVQRREARQEERVSTASYVTRGSGEGEGEAEAEPTSPGNQASPSEGLTEEHGADGEGRSGKKTVMEVKTGNFSTSGCLVILGGIFLGLWLFGLLPESLSFSSEDEGVEIIPVDIPVDPELSEREWSERLTKEWRESVAQDRREGAQQMAQHTLSVLAVSVDEVLLSNWFIDQFEVSTSEKRRIEKELTETSEAYRQEEWANTTVKVLPSDTLVVRVRPFLEGWAPRQAVREVLAEILGERGEGIDFERVQEFPLGREERKLEVKTHGDESRAGYGRYRSAFHTSPFSSGVGGGFWYRWERFLPEDDQQKVTQRGGRIELTPRGKVEFELNLESERRLLDALSSHWVALLALEEKALETGRDADGIYYARMLEVTELKPADFKALGEPEFTSDPFTDWSDELFTKLYELNKELVNDLEWKALHKYVLDLSVWPMRAGHNLRALKIEKTSDGYFIGLRQFSGAVERTGPFQEVPAPYRRFVKTAD